MKVKCISCKGIGGNLPISISKIYDVIKLENIPFSPHRYDDPSGPFYKIKCDNGEEKYIEANRFRELTLDEKRELKLEDLGI
jgi:ribosomal protein S27E